MKKLYLHSFGCKVNQYDGQALREHLERTGYRSQDDPAGAEFILVNSCTVTAEADRQCRQFVRGLLRKNPSARVVVTGCYAARAPHELAALSPRVEVRADRSSLTEPQAPPAPVSAPEGRSRAFVKVQDGCDARCSYCIVPSVRPVLWSRPLGDILGEVRGLVERNCPEMVLTGVHLGRYEGGVTRVLREIVMLPGTFRVRLSSLEIREVDRDLLVLMRDHPDRICPHLHIPLQSAADRILGLMRRPYTSGRFAELLEPVREMLPDAAITTDVIAGFPGETENDFRETHDFIERAGFSRLHAFTYSPRPGTDAERLPGRLPVQEARERSRILQALDARLQETFWRRFRATVRQVVPAGEHMLLSDNYITLFCAEAHRADRGVRRAEIIDRDGKPCGRIIPGTVSDLSARDS